MVTQTQLTQLHKTLSDIRIKHGFMRGSSIHRKVMRAAERSGFTEREARKIADDFGEVQRKAQREARAMLPKVVTKAEPKIEPKIKIKIPVHIPKPSPIPLPLPTQKLPVFLKKPPVVTPTSDLTVAGMRERTLTRKEIEGLNLREVTRRAQKKQTETLGKAQRWLVEKFRPHEKEARLAIEKADKEQASAVEKHNINLIRLEKEVKDYSKKYGGKELAPAVYSIAIAEGKRLDTRIKQSQAIEQGLVDYERRRIELEEVYETKRKKVPKIIRATQSVALGFVSVPIGLATIGVGLGIKPVTTIKEVGAGLWGLPGEVIRRPVETLGEIAGSLAFFYGAGRIASTMKVTPKVSQSFSLEKTVRIGTSPDGKAIWSSEGTIITKLKHPTTGKTIKTIKTQTFSETITSPTKAGAIKAVSDTWAMNVKRQGVQLGLTPKVKVQVGLARARGEMTISPTDVPKLYRGYGRAAVFDIGRAEIIAVPKKVKVKVKLKLKEPMEALSNILLGEIGVRPKVITKITPKERITIRGKERIYRYKALSDIYGKKGAERIIRMEEVGFAQAFIPEEVGVWVGPPLKVTKIPPKPPIIKPPKIIALPPKPPKVVRPPKVPLYKPGQIPGLTTRIISEKAAAKVTAELSAKIIGKVKAVPKVKVKVKVTPAIRMIQFLSPAVIPRVKKVPRVKELEMYKVSEILGPRVIPKVVPKVVERITPAQRTAQRITQALGQQLAVSPKVVPRVTPRVVPTPPKVPTIIRYPMIKKETFAEKRRRKRMEAKLRAQQRAYQASVGAAILGITARKPLKRITGLELRPVIRRKKAKKKPSYLKRIEKAFGI